MTRLEKAARALLGCNTRAPIADGESAEWIAVSIEHLDELRAALDAPAPIASPAPDAPSVAFPGERWQDWHGDKTRALLVEANRQLREEVERLRAPAPDAPSVEEVARAHPARAKRHAMSSTARWIKGEPSLADVPTRVKAAHAIAQALGACYRHGGAGVVLRAAARHGIHGVEDVERTIHSALHALEDALHAIAAPASPSPAPVEKGGVCGTCGSTDPAARYTVYSAGNYQNRCGWPCCAPFHDAPPAPAGGAP